jgi:hypothetical protein
MSFHLTVVSPFSLHGRSYQKGDHITDPALVAEVLEGHTAHSVIKRFPKPEHASGDFYKTDRERAEDLFKKPVGKK